MIDIVTYEAKMKLSWFQRIVCNNGKYYKINETILDMGKLMNTEEKIYAENICKQIKSQLWILKRGY